MFFITETGSHYEVDYNGKRVRRLGGEHVSTPRQGPDGEWKEYEFISTPTQGKQVLIVWKDNIQFPARKDMVPSTLTSQVVSCTPDFNIEEPN